MDDTVNTPVAVLKIPYRDPLFIPFAKGILLAFTGNTNFTDPKPTLLIFTQDIEAYEKAHTLVGKKGQGAATQRNAKKRKVIADLHHLRDYVQGVVETQTSAEDAAAMIVSAGMRVKKAGKRHKAALRARNGDTSGVVLLEAKTVAPVAVYYWQFSLDQRNWSNVPEMMKASAVVSGLTPLTTYYFRFRAMTRKGPRDYSQVVSLVVL